jgi:hypothetical protein
MPTMQERAQGVAAAAALLRERIEKRRDASWQPEPADSARERRARWQQLAPDQAKKIEDGDYFADDLLPQLAADRTMNALAREFLHIARRGNLRMLSGFIEEGFPVNWQDARTGQSALHIAAAAKGRKALLILAESGRCDFLLRDKEGRLASEMAFLFGDDPAAARWLRIHERRQAAERGITLTRRPKVPSA